jgi:hypothetical protein
MGVPPEAPPDARPSEPLLALEAPPAEARVVEPALAVVTASVDPASPSEVEPPAEALFMSPAVVASDRSRSLRSVRPQPAWNNATTMSTPGRRDECRHIRVKG